MSYAKQSYAEELATRPSTVKLAQAIHMSWRDLRDEHSVEDEGAGEWDGLSDYMRWKFLVAADQAINAMQWGKIATDDIFPNEPDPFRVTSITFAVKPGTLTSDVANRAIRDMIEILNDIGANQTPPVKFRPASLLQWIDDGKDEITFNFDTGQPS